MPRPPKLVAEPVDPRCPPKCPKICVTRWKGDIKRHAHIVSHIVMNLYVVHDAFRKAKATSNCVAEMELPKWDKWRHVWSCLDGTRSISFRHFHATKPDLDYQSMIGHASEHA